MWELLLSAGESLLGLLFGPKSDPAKVGEELGKASAEAKNTKGALNELEEAESARSAAEQRAAVDPGSLRKPDQFSRD